MNKYILPLMALLMPFSAILSGAEMVTIGTNAEFPPFSYIENGIIVGFDIDVATEVAKRLGKEPKFKDMPFEALIPDLLLGQVDFIAAGLSYSEERAKRVLFTKSYIQPDPLVIFAKAAHPIQNVDDLKGKKVVVNEGFIADLFLSEKPGIQLTRLPTTADAFLALASGRADAFVTAKSTVDTYLKTQNPSAFSISLIEGTGDTCTLAVSKKRPELLASIQQALDAMEKDGTLDKIRTKWNFR